MSYDDAFNSPTANIAEENGSYSPIDHVNSNSYVVSSDEVSDNEDDSIQDDVVNAEVLWSVNVVMSNIPLKQCDELGNLFAEMFPDSEIAERFTFSKDKFIFLLSYSIAPYLQSILEDQLKVSDYYVISVDTNLNNTSCDEQTNFYITYWDISVNRVKNRYLNSAFLEHARSDALLTASLDCTKFLDKNRILQVSMIGSLINWSFLKALGKNREENQLPKLINIGSCDIYAIHDAFKSGAEKTGWNYRELLKSLFFLFNDYPSGRGEFLDVTCSQILPLEFNDNCWVDNGPDALRAIDLWKNIHQLTQTSKYRNNCQQYSSKSCLDLQEFLNDRLIIAKLHFFSFVASTLKPFINTYQTTKPMVPFLHDDHHSIVRKLMSWFIRGSILDGACTAKLLCEIDLDYKENYVDVSNQNVGFGAESFLQLCLKNDAITIKDLIVFKKGCIVFLVELIEKITQKSCLLSSIAENAGSLNPNKMAVHSKLSLLQFDRLLQKLVELKRLTAAQKEKTSKEFSEFIIRVVNQYKSKFLSFKPNEDRLDDFFFTEIGLQEFPALSEIVKLVLCLTHGRPPIYEDLDQYVQDPGMDEVCIRSIRTVHNHLSSNNLTACSFDVTEKLMISVKESLHQYDGYLKAKKEKLVKRRPSLPNFDIIKKPTNDALNNIQQLCETYRMDIEKLVAKAEAEFTS